MPWLTLFSLKGLSIKASQVESIKQLHDNLMEFDKCPLKFAPLVKASRLRGRFARSRSHISVDYLKRYVHVHALYIMVQSTCTLHVFKYIHPHTLTLITCLLSEI